MFVNRIAVVYSAKLETHIILPVWLCWEGLTVPWWPSLVDSGS